MNNGQYVGPIISRTSPRWRMQELRMSGVQGSSAAGGAIMAGSMTSGIFEPYIPPSASAIMVTASSGASVTSNSQTATGASCHNIVIPKVRRRFFVEFAGGSVYLMLVNEADVMTAANAGQLTMALCEHALLLQSNNSPGTGNSAIAYSRNAAGYLTAGIGQALPYLNGVIAGSNIDSVLGSANNNFSLIDPQLRLCAATLSADRGTPGNLFFPVRSVTSVARTTTGSGYRAFATGVPQESPPYVRLEYIV